MSTSNTSAYVIAVILLFLVGCTADHQESTNDADIKEIEAVIEQFSDAYKARDWDAFSDFFTEDGVWMPPGLAPLKGKDEWRQFVEPWWDGSTVQEIGVTIEEIIVIEDWAIERHSEYQVTLFGDSAEPSTLFFKGVWILHRQNDGVWRIARYIWNENAAPE